MNNNEINDFKTGGGNLDNSRLLSIQLLRCIACFMVFIVHWGQRVHLTGIIRQITNIGEYGPCIFFMLSGFLAARSLSNRSFNPIKYYKKRMIAILPLYYFSIFWFFVSETILDYFNYIKIPEDIYHLRWLRYIFLLNGFIDSNVYFWGNLGMTWSIPVFVFFYLIAPLVFKYINNLKKSILIFISVIISEFIIYYFVLKPLQYHSRIISNMHYFFGGTTIYFVEKSNNTILAGLVLSIITIPVIAIKQYSGTFFLLFSIIILLCVNCENKLNPNIYNKKIINYIDKYSYSLYLMQGILFCSFIDRINKNISSWQTGIIAILTTMIFTWIGHNIIEIPIKTIYKCNNN